MHSGPNPLEWLGGILVFVVVMGLISAFITWLSESDNL